MAWHLSGAKAHIWCQDICSHGDGIGWVAHIPNVMDLQSDFQRMHALFLCSNILQPPLCNPLFVLQGVIGCPGSVSHTGQPSAPPASYNLVNPASLTASQPSGQRYAMQVKVNNPDNTWIDID